MTILIRILFEGSGIISRMKFKKDKTEEGKQVPLFGKFID
jgi:hypothetical protein